MECHSIEGRAMRMMAMAAVLLALSISPVQGAEKPHPVPKGQTVTGRCVGVHDGDSMTVLIDGNRQVKVRLDSIDASELGQAVRAGFEAGVVGSGVWQAGDAAHDRHRSLQAHAGPRHGWRHRG